MDAERYVAIIDDDSDVRLSLARLFAALGVASETFSSAGEYLSRRREDPCCILSDHQMPGMNGLGLLRLLRLNGGKLPFILMSAYGSPFSRQEDVDELTVFVEKPLRAEKLIACFQELLDRQ